MLSTDLARGLMLQVTPKNSIFTRFMKTQVGRIVGNMVMRATYEVPHLNSQYLGLVKLNNYILFEMTGNTPTKVWRKENGNWKNESYIGDQLIEEYSIVEFTKKRNLIFRALQSHWFNIKEDKRAIHGDLTHFNILISVSEEIFYIDKKSADHSRLYDIYYFYAYLRQCLSRCSTLSEKEEAEIINLLDDIIVELNLYQNKEEYIADLEKLNIPKVSGLTSLNAYLSEFRRLLNQSLL